MKVRYTLKGFIAWLKQQPNEPYNYGNACTCLSAQFHKAAGRDYVVASCYSERRRKGEPLAETIERIAVVEPWTIGGALKRATRLRL